jgi:alcohol dehydrogenase class IV
MKEVPPGTTVATGMNAVSTAIVTVVMAEATEVRATTVETAVTIATEVQATTVETVT